MAKTSLNCCYKAVYSYMWFCVVMGSFRGVSGVSGNPLGVSQVFLQLLQETPYYKS